MKKVNTICIAARQYSKLMLKAIILCLVMLLGNSVDISAQCEGGQDVPAHFIDLENIPEGFMSGEFRLGDECCSQMSGNNSCLYFDIAVGTRFVGLQMCFDPPCSIDGYYGVAPVVGDGELFTCSGGDLIYNNADQIDLCKDIFCLPNNPPPVVRLLVCKPGAANNPLGLDIIGIPEIELTVGDVAVGCNTQFDLGGAVTVECGSGSSPPKIVPIAVAWSSTDDPGLDYLSCTNCTDPVFAYTGAPIADCAGQQIEYTASIPYPPNECSVPAPVNKIATVFPEISGTLTVDRPCNPNVIYTYTPDLVCPDLDYRWYDSSGNEILTAAGSTTLVVPGDPNETYCIYVRRTTTLFCDPVVYCAPAFCCDPLVGEDCW